MAPPRPVGVDEIRIPSERSARARERLLLEGVRVDELVFDQHAALAQRAHRTRTL